MDDNSNLIRATEPYSCPLCNAVWEKSNGENANAVSTPGKCPACTNINLYWSQKRNGSCDALERKNSFSSSDPGASSSFPGPGRILHSEIYGNYVVASRNIQPGERIILDRPLVLAPYGPSNILPLCLACCKDVGLNSTNKCRLCRWPVCDQKCSENPIHAENECPILSAAGVNYKDQVNDYISIETLRILLLRERNPRKWKRVLEFEAHVETRRELPQAQETLEYITHFVQTRCKLAEVFDTEIINKIIGITSVNTFWGYRELGRYVSILFDKVSLFAHDCDPNTERSIVFLEDNEGETEKDCYSLANIGIEVKARREIQEGESITIRYILLNQGVGERRLELLSLFYFHCTCSRCLGELAELEKITTKDDGNEEVGEEPRIQSL